MNLLETVIFSQSPMFREGRRRDNEVTVKKYRKMLLESGMGFKEFFGPIKEIAPHLIGKYHTFLESWTTKFIVEDKL